MRLSDAEEGSRDTITDSYDMVDGCKQLDVVSVEPTASNGSINEAPQEQLNESFNLTHEVDKCDLWKNMVKNLDAPLPSPNALHRRSNDIVRDAAGITGNGNMWFVTDSDYRELGTLEECDTDLETCPMSATQQDDAQEREGRGKKNMFVFDPPRGVTSMRTSSPVNSSRRGHNDLADHKESDEGVASDCPALSKYRITSV